ncbi:putative RNA-directed DNA polymerase from transposon BS [Nephila pilipes]|uniref:Putative RNA-directed DNA polymerase from transposon BS n=1 Tax=Nephila pilipes TaxID=299642 RepID=A0A8X6QDT8_NEPPI|nr:putative RNA-directed DNA polymerase from transposon BS [Nephila pilipes]
MIDHLGRDASHRLMNIINISWSSRRLSRDWKRTTVISIRKLQKDARFPESYRPIVLTSVACKIVEKMLLKRLLFYLNSRHLLPKEEYGFKSGHSTTDQVLFICQKIRYAHNFKPTHHAVGTFLELSKAFDTV